jgi:hypothetical protein
MNLKWDDQAISAALKDIPLADLPPGFSQRTMQRVRQARLESYYRQRRLAFEDLALPAFLAVFLILVTLPALGLLYLMITDSPQSQIWLLEARYFLRSLAPGLDWRIAAVAGITGLLGLGMASFAGFWVASGSGSFRSRSLR